MAKIYPSDLTDDEWEKTKHFFERPDPRGNKGLHEKRIIVNAIFYVVKGGIQWRMMPNDLPPWETVYDHFRRLCKRGAWEHVLDSQSVKPYMAVRIGVLMEKKLKGRKRHIAVDILGNLLHIKVHAANIHDTKSGCMIFAKTLKKYPTIEAFSADAGYRGTSVDYVQDILKRFLDRSKKSKMNLQYYRKDG